MDKVKMSKDETWILILIFLFLGNAPGSPGIASQIIVFTLKSVCGQLKFWPALTKDLDFLNVYCGLPEVIVVVVAVVSKFYSYI